VTEPPLDITKLLGAWTAGDREALDRLLPLVYAELRRLARNRLRLERPSQSLQPTALVNEAYVRLVRIKRIQWQNRAHFFALCGRLMRHILVDAARARKFAKRAGGAMRVTLDEALLPSTSPDPDVLALDDALTALESVDPRKSRVVELRFFAGLNVEETAAVLGVSTDTVSRDWKFAKTWLYQELRGERRLPR
jgi:RNA polymerase sigma factor (TIGR02999 family)